MKQQGHIQTHNFREKYPYKCDSICLVRSGYLVDNYFNTSITNMNIITFDLAHPTSINIQKINETTRTTNTILEKNCSEETRLPCCYYYYINYKCANDSFDIAVL